MFHIVDNYVALQSEYLESIKQFYKLSPSDSDTVGHAMHGALKLIDAIYLHEHLLATQPRRILEVGSFLGFSSRWILEASQPWGAQVTSVDPGLRHRKFDHPRLHARHFCEKFAERLTLLDACLSAKNESMFMRDYLGYEPKLSPREALARMDKIPVLTEPFGIFDFAFLDGDHHFESTVADVLLISRMMPDGGTILVHDALSHPEVIPALEYLSTNSENLFLTGVNGESFHFAADRIGKLGARDPISIKAPLSDGLGVIQVSPR